MVLRELLKIIMAGAFIAYVFIHPLIMVISYFMSDMSHLNGSPTNTGLLYEILRSFSIPMLPWSLAFAILGGYTGFFFHMNRQAHGDKRKLIIQLQKSLAEIKKLSGFLSICASCKKIRDNNGFWNQMESYIKEHSEADFTHGICPECAEKIISEDLVK